MLDRAGGSSDKNTFSTPINSTPAVKKSSPKPEEEISIEDIPF